MPYLYPLTAHDSELELARAECAVMTAGEATGRLGSSSLGVDVSNAAYLSLCVRELASAAGFEELLERVASLGLVAEGFAIRVERRGSRPDRSRTDLCAGLADVIGGRPNLSAPRVEFALIATPHGYSFGQVISRCGRGWLPRVQRPHTFSWALPVRLARALVNLVAAPGDRLIDLTCGIGTVVAEALAMGVDAYGCEINPKVAGMAVENLRAEGWRDRVFVADAATVRGSFDATVVDLPYGHTSVASEALYEALLGAAGRLAPRVAIVSGGPIEPLIERLGQRVALRARVPKGLLVRHVYLTRRP